MRLLVASLLLLSVGVHADTLQLKEADLPALIESRNNHALGAKDHVTAAEKLTGHLTRSYLPKIEASVGSESFKTRGLDSQTQPFGGVGATLNIFNSGKDSLEDKIRANQLDAAKGRASQAKHEEIKKARKAFWSLVAQRELLSALEDGLKESDRNLSSANTRIRAGSATDTDRLEFEMYRVELEQDIARTKLSIGNLKRDLLTILNLPPGTTIETQAVVSHEHDDKILSASLEIATNPEVQSVTSQATIANLRRSQASRAWLPKVDLFANQTLYTFREREFADRSDRWDTVFGIQLSMELFNGGTSWAESASLNAEALGLEREAVQTRAELTSAFEGAKAELRLTHQLVHDSETTLQKNSRYFTRSMDEYRRGVKNSLDILNVSQRSLSVKRRYIELRRDYQLARADLLAALGQ